MTEQEVWGLQISMQYPVVVQVMDATKQLYEQRFDFP